MTKFRRFLSACLFLLSVTAMGQTVNRVEYFWDTDPGRGHGTRITGYTASANVTINTSISTSSLTPGIHMLGLRGRSSRGVWSPTTWQRVVVGNEISRIEYFFDTDPGFDRGIAYTGYTSGSMVTINNASLNATGVSDGFHQLGIRTRTATNGMWSPTYWQQVLVNNRGVTQIEYFYDTDPGYGNGRAYTAFTPSPLVSINNGSLNATGVGNGFHALGIRAKSGGNGMWSPTYWQQVLVNNAGISAIEYFWDDTDPGQGQATAITGFTPAPLVNVTKQISTAGLSTGVHRLAIRARSGNGLWSPTYFHTVFVGQGADYAEYYWDIDPGFGQGTAIPFASDTVVMIDLHNIAVPTSYGLHILYLRAKAGKTWSPTYTQSYCIGPEPHFSLVLDNNEVCQNEQFIILDESEGASSLTHYTWDMQSDGVVDDTTRGDWVYSYTQPGIYTITMGITNSTTCQNTCTQEIVVRHTAAPTISISRSANNVCAGTEVTFTANVGNVLPTYNPVIRWYRNGTMIAGVTGSTLQLSDLANNDVIRASVKVNNPCASNDSAMSGTLTMRIYPMPDVTMEGPSVITNTESAFMLINRFVTSPGGGTYRINGNTATLFNPRNNSLGEYEISYSYTNSNGCTKTVTDTFRLVSTTQYTITALPDNATHGTVTGSGTYAGGSTCTLIATPAAGYRFAGWTNNGNTVSLDSIYTFYVNSDLTLTANFIYEIQCGIALADLPYTENFDGYTTSTTPKTGVEPPCWTLAHQDVSMANEYKPMIYYSNAHSGAYSLILNKRGIYAMPRLEMIVSTLQMQFYVKQTQAKYQLQVGVMSDLGNASTFVPITTINNSSTTASVLCTVDFSSYTGSGRYIAFRNVLASGITGDYSINYVDDITLSMASTYTIAATVNPTAGGTVTGTGTYTSGSSCTLTATPATGYQFVNWTSGNSVVSTNAAYSFNVTSNRTLTANFVRTYTIAATAYPAAGGTITGTGTYTNGSSCTLTATPALGYEFVNWTNGSSVVSTNASYTFTVTSNRTLTANFSPITNCGISIADLPYTDNFDSYTTSTTAKTGVSVPCWTLAHQDVTMADEYKPMVYYSSAQAHSGNYSLILNKRCIFAMPQYLGNVSDLQISFYLCQTQAKYQLQVGVMSDLSNASTFVPVATINNSSTTASVLQTVDFASYSGSGRYIAFRNVLASGQSGDYSCNYIDDITLELRPASCPAITAADLPYSENFDSYTTSTTAKTGVEVPCWTLANQDVPMTDEYKPMVYYSSAHSHSGSYSIILNKRGIFAMPEFDGDVSSLQLSFYVRQTMAKYQLQVGVMSDLSNASTFVPVATINNSSTTASVLQTVDFTSYSGSGRYIAFRNVLASGQSGDYSCNYIDDILLELRPASCPAITATDLPYTENFDSYTTSTTAKTGVEVPCWTLAHQDVSMTDEYKPMVYYSSAHSHSGSYSIILNKRGIFAMPEFDGDISTLQLSFYVRQTLAKYQLQVGVMSDLSNASTFVPVATINNSSTSASVLQTVDFASYSGSGRYIAFRNVLASGQSGDYSCNYIDDILLESRPQPVVYTVTATASPTEGGSVTGAGNYTNGSSCTLRATPATNYTFVNWTNGSTVVSTNATYTFSVTANSSFTANFAPMENCGIAIADLPYTENFDSYTTSTTAKTGVSVSCWTLAHQDVTMTDEYKPMVYYSSAHSHSGSYSIILNKRGIFAMPEFDGNVSALQLSFYVRQTQAKYQLQVGVMSDLSNASTFVPVATINNSSTTASELQTVDFASYTGSGRYIAFRNVLASGQSGDYSCNYIDDILLELRPSSCPAITAADLPYSENFDSYTTSTTAKTGVEPDCWTLAHQDVVMTDEYKPMLYYASSNAHSGSYSLILNKRGIYAMPEFDGDISSLQLSLYVKQGQAKYQLQVGVMSDLSNASTFVPVATFNNSSTTASEPQTVDFASYSGSGRYIAFRNVLASGQSGDYSCNYIDDILLELRPSSCPAITAADLPYTENFDSYTTSTTAKTGVEVPCWTLAHQDVAMTDEYKPMVYYSTAHSHSSSYSIILNKRGIFAMPEFDGDVSSLQLSFYVRQTMTKYQLQVGVMSDLSNASSFVPVATINNSSTTASVLQTVDFASYSGSGRYIAFRNVLASGQSGDYSCNYIDDILLESRPQPVVYSVTATASPTVGGSVTGAGNYTNGSSCTLRATPATNYTFVNWTNGSTVVSTNATYTFSVTANSSFTANFAPMGNCGIAIADLPYTENFDSQTTSTTTYTGVEPPCWTLALQEVTMSNAEKPMIYYGSSNAHSGNYSLILNKRGIYAMPEFEGNINELIIGFYVLQTRASYNLTVGVMSDLSDPSTYTPVATANNSSTSEYMYHEVDFSSYEGDGRYIVFRNTNTAISNYSVNYIDDISLRRITPPCGISIADLPYTDNFDSYTSSTTAKTGVEPTCWTLALQEVSMTDEYKPMVYYGSATSHSGNYSLILNKRGIYAMPAYNGDISSLQMNFYLKQTRSTYELTVGVMDDLDDPDTFEPITSFNNSTTDFVSCTVDFSNYSGMGNYIVFRNTNNAISDFSVNYIDDISLTSRANSCNIQINDLPYTENFDSYTTSTTAKTGVDVPCWTLAHQDVAMTDEYKPMVYYSSAHSHSGDYSIILNKRGIFAMPEFSGDVSTLQLSFYLRQTMAKYQLQVGVMSDLSNASSFVPVATFNNSSTTASVLRTVNFSAYTGSGHYIAFRNILASGQTGDYSCNYIDDITLSLAASKGLDDNGNDSSDNEPLSQKWMTVFPNPTSGMITIEADGEIERIDIFDYTGRCVATFEHQSTVDLSRFAAGLYTLRCTLPDRIEVRRVVKQ